MSFTAAIEFWRVVAVGFAAMNRRNPSFRIRFACVVRCIPVTADVLTDLGISEPVVSLQQNLGSINVLGTVRSLRGERLKLLAFLLRKLNDVLLPTHSSRYALRADKLVLLRLGRY